LVYFCHASLVPVGDITAGCERISVLGISRRQRLRDKVCHFLDLSCRSPAGCDLCNQSFQEEPRLENLSNVAETHFGHKTSAARHHLDESLVVQTITGFPKRRASNLVPSPDFLFRQESNGGASGMGRAIARRFLESGASVVIFDINPAEVKGTTDIQGPVLVIVGDVSREEDVRRAVQQTVARFPSLDILVNNAGIEIPGTVVNMTAEDWERQLAVNLKGAFLFSKYSIPFMRQRGGAILNISSIDALVSYPMNAAYDASKAALLAFTRTLAIDHGRDGIRVNAICPGYIETPLLNSYFQRQPDSEELRRRVVSQTPVGRLGTPLDIAEAALFLVSDAAAFISGTYLVVDGGITAAGP
jgi:NAD(P)-dependent dehydrogenase (short-subunit alcohol dehydrogenase family)